MRLITEDGPVEMLGGRRYQRTRQEVAQSYQEKAGDEALKQNAIMRLAGIMDQAPEYDGCDSWEGITSLRTEIRELGQALWNQGGMPLMLRTADELWSCIHFGVRSKTPGIKPLEHYEMCFVELDRCWNGTGDASGEPIRDYWMC